MTPFRALMALGLVKAESSSEPELLDRRQLQGFDWPEGHVWDACAETTDPENSDCKHVCNWYDMSDYGVPDYKGYCEDGYTFREEEINEDWGGLPACATICTQGARMVGGFEIDQIHRIQSKTDYQKYLLSDGGSNSYIQIPATSGSSCKLSLFYARDGLIEGENHISFESVDKPDHFLRHSSFELQLSYNDGSDLFKQDATFVAFDASAIGFQDPDAIALLSVNYPSYVVDHSNSDFRVRLTNTEELRIDDPNDYPAAFWVPEKIDYVEQVCGGLGAGATAGIVVAVFGLLACVFCLYMIKKGCSKAAESVQNQVSSEIQKLDKLDQDKGQQPQQTATPQQTPATPQQPQMVAQPQMMDPMQQQMMDPMQQQMMMQQQQMMQPQVMMQPTVMVQPVVQPMMAQPMMPGQQMMAQPGMVYNPATGQYQ